MGGMCRMAAADMQGGMLDPSQCTGDTEGNPFEQHAACIVEAIGVNSPPQIGGELQGVPMGTNCTLADGGGSATPQTPQPTTESRRPRSRRPTRSRGTASEPRGHVWSTAPGDRSPALSTARPASGGPS
jgi:hypothetical protein